MNWKEQNGFLVKEFEFEDFRSAVEFINAVANAAEKAAHHPDILLHGYNKVSISLRTHSEDAVTDRDRNLAEQIDQIRA